MVCQPGLPRLSVARHKGNIQKVLAVSVEKGGELLCIFWFTASLGARPAGPSPRAAGAISRLTRLRTPFERLQTKICYN